MCLQKQYGSCEVEFLGNDKESIQTPSCFSADIPELSFSVGPTLIGWMGKSLRLLPIVSPKTDSFKSVFFRSPYLLDYLVDCQLGGIKMYLNKISFLFM